MFKINPYIVYIKLDDFNRIISINSNAFLSDTTGWVEIDYGFGDKYHHAQGNYFDKPICNELGIYIYKLEDGKAVERTEAEIEADRQALSNVEETPSQLDIIEAQVTYTAMMTDTLLEV